MEMWDLYDVNRVKTNKVVNRGAALGSNEFHLVVHVCILNSNDQLLIQQRQPFKKGWPGMWDITIGGSAQTGENSCLAAERETFEEIGYPIDLSLIRPACTSNFEKGFDDFYIVQADLDTSILKLQKSEVKTVKWAHKHEIIKMIQNESFIPYHISLIEMIFDMKTQYGALTK